MTVPEHARIFETAQDFELAIADTPSPLRAAFRLRHQVYCLERRYEHASSGLEKDCFDDRASHVILTQRSTGRVVGTVRLVVPRFDIPGPDLPMKRLC